MPTNQVEEWIAQRRGAQRLEAVPIPLRDLERWSFDPGTGNLGHETGRFFKIHGIEVRTDFGPVGHWRQPIMNQPEIGILGFLVKEFDGVLHFLVQGKAEPGNLGGVQLSPTLQATRSNFTRIHGGGTQPFLEHFRRAEPHRILVDQLQSEHGARFLRKRNRNMIVEVTGPIEIGEDFCWLTLGQLLQLLWRDNVLNMDSRTVLACVPLAEPGVVEDREILTWISRLKTEYRLRTTDVPLRGLTGWRQGEEAIRHEDDRHFEVIGVSVKAGRREVAQWTQPMVRPREIGTVAFVTRSVGGVREYLVQARVEPGNLDLLELGPTVQFQPGSYRSLPPFADLVAQTPWPRVLFSTLQSEEGGRFFHEQHRHLIVALPPAADPVLPQNYRWMTARQLRALVRYSNQLNVQARSLLACIGALGMRE